MTNKKKLQINGNITVGMVRLVDQDAKMLGVVSLEEALSKARAVNLDLVEVVPDADPPVCKILDYSKFRYQSQKNVHEAKKKQKRIHMKELKLRAGIEQHDYNVKLKSLLSFLERGDKVKLSLRFIGREIHHPENGMNVMQRVINDTADVAKVDQQPKIDGNNLSMILVAKQQTS